MCESGFLKIEPSNAPEIEEPDGVIWKKMISMNDQYGRN
jgi:hypothetical protein